MRIYKIYENDLERTWYDSSNILYSECDDFDNKLKNVRILFKNGAWYQYKDVKVQDYLLFREDVSQGKALRKFLFSYDYEKIGNKDVKSINEELKRLLDKEKGEPNDNAEKEIITENTQNDE